MTCSTNAVAIMLSRKWRRQNPTRRRRRSVLASRGPDVKLEPTVVAAPAANSRWRRRRSARAPDAWRLEFLRVIRRAIELDVLELHLSFENLAVIFDKPQGAVEVDVQSRPPQQTFVFEPFEVGKVA